MDFYKLLADDNKWNEFLKTKIDSDYISNKDAFEFKDFIENKKYLDIVNKIINNEYDFSLARKVVINKIGKKKKRIVYIMNKDETIILKYINYLLYEYDYMFSPNLYSFRKHKSVRQAIESIQNIHLLNKKYAYKVDISNYFNSIPVDILLNRLENDIDKDLYNLLDNILSTSEVKYEGKIIEEVKGIMAGVPVSAFLANYYLKDMDNYFYVNNIDYYRYADDILVFADSLDEINKYKEIIISTLNNNGLSVNPDKEYYFNPMDSVEFLGFSICGKKIDLSKSQIMKMKGKIRRSARGFRRWKLEKNVRDIPTLVAMNKKYNNKFYGKSNDELSWKYWFFPIINTTEGLHEIDLYMQDWQRYIITGVHNKKNYEKVPYEFLKKCKYRPLVHEYYSFNDENDK